LRLRRTRLGGTDIKGKVTFLQHSQKQGKKGSTNIDDIHVDDSVPALKEKAVQKGQKQNLWNKKEKL